MKNIKTFLILVSVFFISSCNYHKYEGYFVVESVSKSIHNKYEYQMDDAIQRFIYISDSLYHVGDTIRLQHIPKKR